jgi:hypothetical protein
MHGWPKKLLLNAVGVERASTGVLQSLLHKITRAAADTVSYTALLLCLPDYSTQVPAVPGGAGGGGGQGAGGGVLVLAACFVTWRLHCTAECTPGPDSSRAMLSPQTQQFVFLPVRQRRQRAGALPVALSLSSGPTLQGQQHRPTHVKLS